MGLDQVILEEVLENERTSEWMHEDGCSPLGSTESRTAPRIGGLKGGKEVFYTEKYNLVSFDPHHNLARDKMSPSAGQASEAQENSAA